MVRGASSQDQVTVVEPLVRHLAAVERQWFRRLAGEDFAPLYLTDEDPAGDFHPLPGDTVEQAIADYRAESEHSNEVRATPATPMSCVS